jgi:hypothetical protein
MVCLTREACFKDSIVSDLNSGDAMLSHVAQVASHPDPQKRCHSYFRVR